MTQFINWLKQELPYQNDSDRDLAKKVARVLIAGDNMRNVPELDAWAGIVKLKKVFDDGTMPLERGVETLDRLLMDLTVGERERDRDSDRDWNEDGQRQRHC